MKQFTKARRGFRGSFQPVPLSASSKPSTAPITRQQFLIHNRGSDYTTSFGYVCCCSVAVHSSPGETQNETGPSPPARVSDAPVTIGVATNVAGAAGVVAHQLRQHGRSRVQAMSSANHYIAVKVLGLVQKMVQATDMSCCISFDYEAPPWEPATAKEARTKMITFNVKTELPRVMLAELQSQDILVINSALCKGDSALLSEIATGLATTGRVKVLMRGEKMVRRALQACIRLCSNAQIAASIRIYPVEHSVPNLHAEKNYGEIKEAYGQAFVIFITPAAGKS